MANLTGDVSSTGGDGPFQLPKRLMQQPSPGQRCQDALRCRGPNFPDQLAELREESPHLAAFLSAFLVQSEGVQRTPRVLPALRLLSDVMPFTAVELSKQLVGRYGSAGGPTLPSQTLKTINRIQSTKVALPEQYSGAQFTEDAMRSAEACLILLPLVSDEAASSSAQSILSKLIETRRAEPDATSNAPFDLSRSILPKPEPGYSTPLRIAALASGELPGASGRGSSGRGAAGITPLSSTDFAATVYRIAAALDQLDSEVLRPSARQAIDKHTRSLQALGGLVAGPLGVLEPLLTARAVAGLPSMITT